MRAECNCDLTAFNYLCAPDKLIALVGNALQQLYCEDKLLIQISANERSICHRLGIHLENALQEEVRVLKGGFQELKVDCEYNRVGFDGEPKTQSREALLKYVQSYGAVEDGPRREAEYALTPRPNASDQVALVRRTLPDIAIHRRGCDCQNLLIIEAKTTATQAWQTLIDRAKLHVFTSQIPNSPYYRYGLFVVFGNTSPDYQVWEKGEPLKL